MESTTTQKKDVRKRGRASSTRTEEARKQHFNKEGETEAASPW